MIGLLRGGGRRGDLRVGLCLQGHEIETDKEIGKKKQHSREWGKGR
jgi:hypothetical protein